MSMFRVNNRARQDLNTGLNITGSAAGGRFFNKDGSPNVRREGGNIWERITVYQHLLRISFGKFMLVVLLFFLIVNLLFTAAYYAIGIEHLAGLMATSPLEKITETFFFSVQTFTTVGYGRVNPVGFVASAIAGLEALVGILSAALATGLLYGRFSKPQAYLQFSEAALISPYQDKQALMFRLVPYTSHHLTEVLITVRIVMKVNENGKDVNKFFTLPLELDNINSLFLSWTVVHAITEESPLFNLTEKDFKKHQLEVMVQLRGFDEVFANTVFARASYTADEIIFGAKFRLMFRPDDQQNSTIINLDLLNTYDKVDIP